MKTAVLFEASCRVGALLAGHPPAHIEACAQFGSHLGIAYQIFDDFVDLLQDDSRAGKTLGTDAASGKLTLPMILERNRRGGDPTAEIRNGADPRKVISAETWRECFRILDVEIVQAEKSLTPIENSSSTAYLLRLTSFLRASAAKLAPQS
jgi:octaprenyl-diphosphate synthase